MRPRRPAVNLRESATALTPAALGSDNPRMNVQLATGSSRVVLGILLGFAAFGFFGCSISTSFSDSSESSSDSSESFSDSSRSSSESSSPEKKEASYRDDVRDYTAAYVKSGGQIADFDRRLGELAQKRGITNWEDNLATYEGIGRGLAKAGVQGVELDTYVTNLAHGDATKAAAIRKGYVSA
jgi:hypothetical protein